MIGYVMVGTSDLARSAAYYDAVLAPLGLTRVENDAEYVGFAPVTAKDQIEFYVTKPYNGEPASVGNGTMIALLAESRTHVDQFHQTALEQGGKDEGSPGPRPADSEIYYAYARDPDGNKICAFSTPSA